MAHCGTTRSPCLEPVIGHHPLGNRAAGDIGRFAPQPSRGPCVRGHSPASLEPVLRGTRDPRATRVGESNQSTRSRDLSGPNVLQVLRSDGFVLEATVDWYIMCPDRIYPRMGRAGCFCECCQASRSAGWAPSRCEGKRSNRGHSACLPSWDAGCGHALPSHRARRARPRSPACDIFPARVWGLDSPIGAICR